MAGASTLALALTACGNISGQVDQIERGNLAAIPDSLAPFGEGYPDAGDPCRNLGDSAVTSAYLDDSAILVGCPDEASAEALRGNVVGIFEGVRLISVPAGDANAGFHRDELARPVDGEGDAKVAGTDYDATATVKCGFEGSPPEKECSAGVKRKWGEDGTTLVEITKPNGRKRAIFFDGTTPYGADSAQADGSAGWDFEHTRQGDRVTITFGPETYILVDALIEGG